MDLQDLHAQRDKLLRIRAKGIDNYTINGRTMTFRSERELTAAIAAIDAEIAKLSRPARSRTTYPQTSKGLT